MQLTQVIMPKFSDKSINLFNISFFNNICISKYGWNSVQKGVWERRLQN